MATTKQLRLALATLVGSPQVHNIGSDGMAAILLLNGHITGLELAEQPKLRFKDIAPGTRFHAMHLGKYPDSDLVFVKLQNGHNFIAGSGVHSLDEYAIQLGTGRLYWFGPDTIVRLAE